MAEQEGSSPLFAIFFLSIYSLLLIPLTIYRLCNAASSENVVKPWEAVRRPSWFCLFSVLSACGSCHGHSLPANRSFFGFAKGLLAFILCSLLSLDSALYPVVYAGSPQASWKVLLSA